MYNQGYRPSQQPQQPSQGNWYAPPPQPGKPAGKKRGAPAKKRKKQPKKHSLRHQLIKLLLLVVLLGAACAAGYVWKIQSDVKPYANVFLDHVSVDGIDLSGKTWE